MHVTPGDGGSRALIVALHGAGGTPAGAIEAFGGARDEPGLVLIAPASKGQTWSILRSEQDLDLESVNLALAEAYERCSIDRRRLAVGGFSDGATYALTLGVSNGDLFPTVIAFSPGGIVAGEQRGVPRFFVSHGTHDSVLPIATAGDAVVRKLREAGYPVTYRRFRGDHEVPPAMSRAAVRWFLGAP
jgi:predicted esterase